jgi:hypothetical protein
MAACTGLVPLLLPRCVPFRLLLRAWPADGDGDGDVADLPAGRGEGECRSAARCCCCCCTASRAGSEGQIGETGAGGGWPFTQPSSCVATLSLLLLPLPLLGSPG